MKVLSLVFLSMFGAVLANAQIDHGPLNELLQKHVRANGTVNYEGFIADKTKLQSYLNTLSKNAPKAQWSQKEHLAFWINAYNAFTIKAIVDHYPVKSITEIKPSDAKNIWKSSFFSIGGKKMSLDQIENDVLRVEFDEPRMHFAINCASISCPVLRNEAYVAAKLDVQLTEQSKRFFRDQSKNVLSANSVKISSIFNWFQEDFTKHGTLIDFINKYADVRISQSAKVSYMDYDWNLNG